MVYGPVRAAEVRAYYPVRVKESFSSELGELPDRPGDSFSNEFRGASMSTIERERPPRALDIGRGGRRLMLGLILGLAALGGGGWALWYWSEPIGEWIASWNPSESPAGEAGSAVADGAEPAEPVEPVPPSVEPDPTPVAPEPGTLVEPVPPAPLPQPIPGGELPVEPLDRVDGEDPLPVEPLDRPPTGPDGRVEAVSVTATTVRGRVSESTVTARLAPVDEALAACWAKAAAAHGRPANLSLRFTIKWNGRAQGVLVGGDAPDAVERCVEEAVPTSGWPQPRDGGEASVSRQWKLREVL